jgi:hypothetical protein
MEGRESIFCMEFQPVSMRFEEIAADVDRPYPKATTAKNTLYESF